MIKELEEIKLKNLLNSLKEETDKAEKEGALFIRYLDFPVSTTKKLLEYIEELQETNKVLTKEINTGTNQEMLLTVCGIPIGKIPELQVKAELGEHYKHLYSEVKKQKDDVVEYIKSLRIFSARNNGKILFAKILNEILRMLGEIDENES